MAAPATGQTELAVNVAGFLRGALGLGEAARLYVAALRAAGVPVSTTVVDVPLPDIGDGAVKKVAEFVESEEARQAPFNLVCVNAPELPAFYEDVGKRFFRGRRSIGVWAWEVDKVPNDWRVFDENEIFKTQLSGLSPQGEAAAKSSIWMVAFDASPKASLSHFFTGDSPYPQGFAQVRQLSDEQKDSISLASIRNTVFPLNQLQTQDPTSVEFLKSDDLVLAGGIHGNRIIFNVRLGDTFYTVNQTGLVNPQSSRLYLFIIGCEAHCYLKDMRTIDEIVKSWTVKER